MKKSTKQPVSKGIISQDSAERKAYPLTTGFLDYFPAAIMEGARHSFVGNLKHNPGEPLHWARDKSLDHADCIGRHLLERGRTEIVVIDGVSYVMRHSAALLWRAAAMLQEEMEREGYETPVTPVISGSPAVEAAKAASAAKAKARKA